MLNAKEMGHGLFHQACATGTYYYGLVSANIILTESKEGQASFLTDVFGGCIMDVIALEEVLKIQSILHRNGKQR